MTVPIKVLVADDEPLARELLRNYLQKLPRFQLAAECGNAIEAFTFLTREKVDVLLLDINMPEISGIEFLKTLREPPLVIFTTAYAEYAVESYEFRAVDYLLKPVTFNRFLQGIQKVTELIDARIQGAENSRAGEPPVIFVRSDGKMIRIHLDELLFVEGYKNYVRLWTETGKVMVHATMKHMEEQLCGRHIFLRIAKSYIINLLKVSEVENNFVKIKNERLVIGISYREELRKVLERYKLG